MVYDVEGGLGGVGGVGVVSGVWKISNSPAAFVGTLGRWRAMSEELPNRLWDSPPAGTAYYDDNCSPYTFAT